MGSSDVLKMGTGPVQPSWSDDSTGVENVGYDAVTAEGGPDNPGNAAEVVKRGLVNVGGGRPETDSVHEVPVSGRQKRMSYVELYERLSPNRPKTPEELEKERRKQKREAIFSSIGEGISALSNLFFTTQYAPNAFDPSRGLAGVTKARFDRLKKERADNEREYLNGYMRAMQMDDAVGYQGALAEFKEREQNRKDAESNIKIALQQADLDYKEAKTDGQGYLNELYRLKGEALAKGMGAQVALIEEKIKTEQSKQPKNLSGGGGGGGKKTSLWKAENRQTGEVIEFYATDRANAWSLCPEGFVIRQEPTERVVRERKKDSLTNLETESEKTVVSNSPTRGSNNAGKYPNASKIKY